MIQSSIMAQYPQQAYSQGNAPANMYPNLPPSNPATISLSSTPIQQPAPVAPEEPEEDDLRQLHIPAMPTVEGDEAYPSVEIRRKLT